MFKYTIKSKIYGDAILNECVSSAAVKPGYLVELATVSGADALKPHASAGGFGLHLVALEDSMVGKTVEDEYASGANVKYIEGRAGDEFYMVLKASENVAKFDMLASDGAGRLVKAASGKVALFQALEASNVANDALVLVKVINPVTIPEAN